MWFMLILGLLVICFLVSCIYIKYLEIKVAKIKEVTKSYIRSLDFYQDEMGLISDLLASDLDKNHKLARQDLVALKYKVFLLRDRIEKNNK